MNSPISCSRPSRERRVTGVVAIMWPRYFVHGQAGGRCERGAWHTRDSPQEDSLATAPRNGRTQHVGYRDRSATRDTGPMTTPIEQPLALHLALIDLSDPDQLTRWLVTHGVRPASRTSSGPALTPSPGRPSARCSARGTPSSCPSGSGRCAGARCRTPWRGDGRRRSGGGPIRRSCRPWRPPARCSETSVVRSCPDRRRDATDVKVRDDRNDRNDRNYPNDPTDPTNAHRLTGVPRGPIDESCPGTPDVVRPRSTLDARDVAGRAKRNVVRVPGVTLEADLVAGMQDEVGLVGFAGGSVAVTDVPERVPDVLDTREVLSRRAPLASEQRHPV